MRRTQKAYALLFRDLLRSIGARRTDHGVRWLFARASQRGASLFPSHSHALVKVHLRLQEQAQAHLERKSAAIRKRQSSEPVLLPQGESQHATPTTTPPANSASPVSTHSPNHPIPSAGGAPAQPLHFFCDAGLGGLARWLRAAGYEAFWMEGIADGRLLQEALAHGCILLTTDSLLLERRRILRGEITAFWLPPSLSIPQQLDAVFRRFQLRRRPSRCMRCGGTLETVDLQSVWDQIPPRTRLWLREYFRCQQCRQLFWHGTHWQRIQRILDNLECSPPGAT